MYAVIDLETTGLRTSRHDRVVEVAVVRLDRVLIDRHISASEADGLVAAADRFDPSRAELGMLAGLSATV
jgi:DNA polymerase-3 subunit epsilon